MPLGEKLKFLKFFSFKFHVLIKVNYLANKPFCIYTFALFGVRKVRGRSFYSPQQVGFVVLSITRPQAAAREERPGDEVGSESHRLTHSPLNRP